MTNISLITEPELLIEADETRAFLNFTLSEPPPPSGITVALDAPNLDDFNLSQIQVEGGEITLEDELVEELNSSLDGTRAPEVPGAVVAIVSPSGSYFGASGLANVEDDIPLQSSDRFEIGSITKTFTATTILQLVEEGVLSLEDNLTDWLPESVTADIPNANEITLENLLQHTSGIADYVDVLFAQAASNPLVFTQDWQPEELVDLIDGQEALFAPGESFYYSNTNFLLLGIVIESATGNNVAAEIRDRIIEPLELDNTFFAGEEEIPEGYVSGYWDFDGDGTLNNIDLANLSWAWSTGAMVSNAEDLDTFARNLFAGDLLQPETLEMMLDTIPAVDNDNYSSYGLGVGTIESPNRFWYIHRGQTLGYRSNMWYSPEDDLTYIELINGFSSDNLVRDILPAYREGINDATLEFTITESEASISIPVLNDGTTEDEEIATFTLESGEGYEIDPDNNSGEFAITENSDPDLEPTVSLRVEPELLIETEESNGFFRLNIDPLVTGTTVIINSPNLEDFDFNSQLQVEGGEIDFISDEELSFTFTEADASIRFSVLNDGEIEEEEIVPFSLVEGEGYQINPDASSDAIAIYDTFEDAGIRTNIGLGSLSDSLAGEEAITFFFEVFGPFPEEGLYVYLDSDVPNSVSSLFEVDAAVSNDTPTPLALNSDGSGFAVRFLETNPGSSEGRVTIPLELNGLDGVSEITYELQTRDEIADEDLAAIEVEAQIDDYDLNLQMFSTTIDGIPVVDDPQQPETNPETEAIFGSLDADIIEVNESNELIFAGDANDIVDLSTGEGNNRVYAGNGDDTLILGESDRILAGDGSDRIFVTNGGNNTITGGAGTDQFWIASAEIPQEANIITDFTVGEDVMGIAGLGVGFVDVSMTDLEGDVLIAARGSDLAILQGVDETSLTADDFAFA
ncbi:MAG: serine hydrolase [Cyanobacteria bacterium P01_G01_bin.19]